SAASCVLPGRSGLSVRRPCTLFKVARSALSYQGRKAAKSAPVVERLKELSARYPRYGLRKQLGAWMVCAAVSLTACDGAASYVGTIWDNPLPAGLSRPLLN